TRVASPGTRTPRCSAPATSSKTIRLVAMSLLGSGAALPILEDLWNSLGTPPPPRRDTEPASAGRVMRNHIRHLAAAVIVLVMATSAATAAARAADTVTASPELAFRRAYIEGITARSGWRMSLASAGQTRWVVDRRAAAAVAAR